MNMNDPLEFTDLQRMVIAMARTSESMQVRAMQVFGGSYAEQGAVVEDALESMCQLYDNNLDFATLDPNEVSILFGKFTFAALALMGTAERLRRLSLALTERDTLNKT